MATADRSSDGLPPKAGLSVAPLKAFLNYRREDTAAEARLLYDRLVSRFGAENVFLDVVDLQPGMKWLEEIKSRGASSGVFIALIGPRWMASLTDRSQTRFAEPVEDVVRREIEYALSRGSGVEVIPILVGEALMPHPDKLPRSIRALTGMQAVQLRHARFDQDVEHLIRALEEIQRRPDSPGAHERPTPQPTAPSEPRPTRTPSPDSNALSPDERHYETVLRHMVGQGTVVPLLGSRVNAADRDQGWREGCGTLPDAEELAADLAQRFGFDFNALDLAKVAQYVYVTSGRPDLSRSLKQILEVEAEPGAIHRFFACFPRRLEELDLPPRYQMIVTTNYDTQLERAFDEENEPYDLAVYMASGPDKGRFVHFPLDREPEPIAVPNRYGKFLIDDYGELGRSLIVKIHGAVDRDSGDYRWKENYVITEDHYIDYLSRSAIESLVPVQILDKLTASHSLFLGYTMRDWNLRVFLKRVWQGESLGAKSWAIERNPQISEKDFWSQGGVDLFASPLADYVDELNRRLLALRQVET